jgi:hypothetical protein
MTFIIGPDHASAQLAASIVFADTGALASRIFLYDGPAGTGDLLAEVALSKPCGTLAAGALTLHPAKAGGALVLLTGIPRSGVWLSGEGKLVTLGTVTDVDNGGDFLVSGATTAAGETSPTLYAGGVVLLGSLTFS